MSLPGPFSGDSSGSEGPLVAALRERYRIEREIGAGGMATVYLAEDVRHHRKVAIKVLRPELSTLLGPERFLKEIELTAGLQHPHILPLFDSGVAGRYPPQAGAARDSAGAWLLYYVMPYVEGETLRQRLERERQLKVGDAVRIAQDVASALDYAHRHGVVHRDVKPANILLHDGSALVADFGIALAVTNAAEDRLTGTGVSLGTPQYMSPEQAAGEPMVDARSDIYALGALTYEMLVGEPPFTGPSAQAILGRVLTEAPRPLIAQRHTVPPHVELAVLTALEKLPADRFGTAAEFSAALASPATRSLPRPPDAAHARNAMLVAGLAIAALASAGAYMLGRHAAAPPASLPSRLALLSPMIGGNGMAADYRQLAITPTGDAVVFVAVDDKNENALAYQPLDATGPRLIEGARGLLSPQVSLDGRLVVGLTAGLVARDQEGAVGVPIHGGTPRRLPIGVYAGHAAWGSDGTFWFTPADRGGVSRVTSDGRTQSVRGGALSGFQLQQVLADGRTALGVRIPPGASSGPAVLLDLDTGRDRSLIDIDVVEARATAGYLLYVRPDGTMWATAFDEERPQIPSDPVQIADQVSLTGTGTAQWAVAPNGTVAYIPEEPRALVLVARNGAMRTAVEEKHNFHSPRFSPDGRRLTVDFTSTNGRDVYVLSLAQRTLTPATFTRDGHDAVWTPDGGAIDFTSLHGSVIGIHRIRPGSGAPAESLLASPELAYTGTLTPDGRTRITVGRNVAPNSGSDLIVVDQGGRGVIHPLLVDRFETQFPALSPDGHWLAYVSDQSATRQVYVRPFSHDGEAVQVSQEGGTEPVWSRDGKELFYRATTRGTSRLVAASVREGATFEVLTRRTLFDAADIVGSDVHANYDVSPDGSTFAMVRRSPATRIMIIQNLPSLVQRLHGVAAATP